MLSQLSGKNVKEIFSSNSKTINGRLQKWIIEKFNSSFEDV